MTIVEALKNFYKGNAYNEQELKEADNVLDAIRAKYGPYEGANIAEYLQTAIANGVTPGSGGGGGGDIGTIVTITLSTTEAYFNGAPDGSAVVALLYLDGVGWSFDRSLSESDTSLTVALIEESAYCLTVYSEPTVTGDATVKKSAQNEEWEITVSGDCMITT